MNVSVSSLSFQPVMIFLINVLKYKPNIETNHVYHFNTTPLTNNMAPSITITVKDAATDVLENRVAFGNLLEANTYKAVEVFRDVSAPEYREMRRAGTNGFKRVPEIADAQNLTIQARDGTEIELRIIKPTTGASKGSLLHFHAG